MITRTITLENGTKLQATEVRYADEILPTHRLFYELVEEWDIHTGVFKEITDVPAFLAGDERLHDRKYITHHNFHIV